jgi:peptide deformylase
VPVKRVLQLPDEVLTTRTAHVGEVGAEARELAADLIDTMRASPACVGLAANQIGFSLRGFAVDVTGHKKTRICHGLFVMFDPEIISIGSMETGREGCMSVPDLTGDVARATSLTVAGLDAEGARIEISTDAFEARAIQHEIDHLDGLVFLDRCPGPHAVFKRKVYKDPKPGPST